MKFSGFLSLFLSVFFLAFSISVHGESNKKYTLPALPSLNIDLGSSRQAQEERKPEKVIIDRSNIAILDRVAPAKKNSKKNYKNCRTPSGKVDKSSGKFPCCKIIPSGGVPEDPVDAPLGWKLH